MDERAPFGLRFPHFCTAAVAVFGALAIALSIALPGCDRPEDVRPRVHLRVAGSSALAPAMAELAGALANRERIAIETGGGGSMTGIECARSGGVGTLTRPLNDAELASGLLGVEVGTDSIAIVVNRANSVESLTRAQLVDVFARSIRQWRELGGASESITLCGMGRQFGTYEMFVQELGLDDHLSGSFRGYAQASKVVAEVVGDTRAIGFVAYASLLELDPRVETVRVVAIDGVRPSEPRYALVRPLVLVTQGAPQGAAQKFIDLVRSDEGRAILAEHYLQPFPRSVAH
jgi:phosphate transport system substrate-binding protein